MERELEKRFNTFVLLVVFIFVTLAGRAAYLQVVRGTAYEKLAESNRIRVIPTHAPRGTIRDRNGTPIVDSRPAYTVSLIPSDSGFDPAVLDRLSQIIGMPRADLDKLIEERRGLPYEPVRVMTDVTPEIHTKIEEASYELPGVVVDVQPVRNYIYGDLASQALGYVREINDSQLKALQAKGVTDYQMGDIYGQMGIENRLDKYLRGVDGGRQVEVDSYGRPRRTIGEQAPLAGCDVYLTIDLNVQRAAETALDASLKRLQGQGRKARSGGPRGIVAETVTW
jgi:penicillin-binding protein 2